MSELTSVQDSLKKLGIDVDLEQVQSAQQSINYSIKYDQGLLKAFYSRKIMVSKFEPAEVGFSVEIPIVAENQESLEAAAVEVMRVLKNASMPYVHQLLEEKTEGRR